MGAVVAEFCRFEAPELKDPCGRCVRLGDQQASAGMGRGEKLCTSTPAPADPIRLSSEGSNSLPLALSSFSLDRDAS